MTKKEFAMIYNILKIPYRSIKGFITNIVAFGIFVLKFAILGTFRPTIKKLKPTRNRIFIIANGPSLKRDIKDYIHKLKNEDLCMCNQALSTDLAFNLKPKYYILADQAYFGFYEKQEDYDNVNALNDTFSKVDWDMALLVPHMYRNRINANGGGDKYT